MSDPGKHKVKEHKRNQWYPSLGGHKAITVTEHTSSNPGRIWQLLDPDGKVVTESRDELQIKESLAIQGKGWSMRSKLAPTDAAPTRPLNLIGANPLPPKAPGRCTKTIACGGPETEQGESCPSCGCAFGSKRFRSTETEETQ